MKAQLRLNPFDRPFAEMPINGAWSIDHVLDLMDAPVEYRPFIVVRLDGHIIPRQNWKRIRLKAECPDGVLDIVPVPQGKTALALLGTVAAVALTGFIGAGGIATAFGLGASSTFAAGGIGATIAAAGAGLATQVAIGALTAPPPQKSATGGSPVIEAGIGGNALSPGDSLPVIYGHIGYSPPHVMPHSTSYASETLTVEAVLGVQGRCLIENISVNGVPASEVPGLEIETREGAQGEPPRTIGTETRIEQRVAVALKNFDTREETAKQDALVDQDSPQNSYSAWHTFRTDGDADEIVLRFLAPSGIANIEDTALTAVPLRIEFRREGETDWRAGPTLHVFDKKKGANSLRFNVRAKFEKLPTGVSVAFANENYPVYALSAITATGQSFEYQSDPYFHGGLYSTYIATVNPIATGYTTSGMTMSASTEGGGVAWRAANSTWSDYWGPNNNSLPAWVMMAFSSPVTFASYGVVSYDTGAGSVDSRAPTKWIVEISDDGSTWTQVDSQDISAFPTDRTYSNLTESVTASYVRWTFTANNGAASQALRIANLSLHAGHAPGVMQVSTAGDMIGSPAVYTSGGSAYLSCINATVDEDGATLYLDPDEWPKGVYEVRVKRGWAFKKTGLDFNSYSFLGGPALSYFFEATWNGASWVVQYSPKLTRSDLTVESFTTAENTAPFDPEGVALIALRCPSMQISSIYAEFTSYAPIIVDGEWSETEYPTRNPAALYRKLILRDMPIGAETAGELIDEDALKEWYERCDSAGHECNAIVAGNILDEVKAIIAPTGYAAPRDSKLVSIVEDYNRSGDPTIAKITPLNSRDLGTEVILPDVPIAIRAEFFDEDDQFASAIETVYAEGYDETSLGKYAAISYPGFTNRSKVSARAAFDLKQQWARRTRFVREVPFRADICERGALVGLSDHTLDALQACGMIVSVSSSGGNYTSITLDNVMPFSAAQDNLAAVSDLTSLTDILDSSEPIGVAIVLPDGSAIRAKVTNVTDSNVCTFETPFPDDGSIVPGAMQAIVGRWGVAGETIERVCRVMAVRPNEDGSFVLELAESADDILFA